MTTTTRTKAAPQRKRLNKQLLDGQAVNKYTKTTDIWDNLTPGFGVRVSPGGKTKSWTILYRVRGRDQKNATRLTFGRYPHTPVDEARDRARELLKLADQGIDPREHIREQQQAKARAAATTWGGFRDRWLEEHVPTLRGTTKKNYERWAKHSALDDLAELPIASLTLADVKRAGREIGQTHPIEANRVTSMVSRVLSWALDEGLVSYRELGEAAGLLRMRRLYKESSREKTLKEGELAAIWKATDPTGAEAHAARFYAIVRLLLLTGARRSEVVGMRAQELDLKGRTWTIPASRSKNEREHLVPLAPVAVEILEDQLARRPKDCPLVFGGPDCKVFMADTKEKKRLQEKSETSGWTLHDLRRTWVTLVHEKIQIRVNGGGLQKAPAEIIETAVNHVSGTRGGVAGVYNRAEYLNERKQIMDEWAAYVQRLASGGGNVIPMTREGA